MRFFVTGSSNQLASHVLAGLSGAGHEVVYFATWQTGFFPPPGVKVIHGELEELPYLKSEIGYKEFDGVICLNAHTEADARGVLETFWKIGRSFVIASSCNVYRAHGRFHGTEMGDPDSGPLKEDSPLRGRALRDGVIGDKRDIEKFFFENKGATTVLRLPPLYGVEDERFRFLPLMRRILDGRKEIPLGESQANWKWTHGYIGDVAHAFVLAAENPSETKRIYNVGERNTPSIVERIVHIGTILDWQGEVVLADDRDLAPHLRLPGDFSQDWVYDTAKIRNELKYRERTDYYEGLEWAVRWYADNRPEEVVGIDYSYAVEDDFLDEVRVGV
ncbi:MAG: NAD-dependent epimerase/dehydratase family protein [Verrucomicrobiota bacterium]